jgi:hypothetical protein
MDDLGTEIRNAFEREQAVNRPPASLRHDIAAAVAARPRSTPKLEWIAVAAAALLTAAVIAGLLSSRLAQHSYVPAGPVASPSASPSLPVASLKSMTIAQADALIRSTVTGAHPLLLPTAIPADWTAVVTNLSSSFVTVTYTSQDGTKTVTFEIAVTNPPPPGPNGSQTNPRFHGDVHSLYQVDDTTVATSRRFLFWNEPGTWSQPNGLPGVPYFIASDGLTDAQFWAIANSVHT